MFLCGVKRGFGPFFYARFCLSLTIKQDATMHEITIYTDGSALGNPGKGGYGVVLMSGKHYRELSAGYRLTTNNRMELQAVIAGLGALKFSGCRVTVYSDSKYVVDAVSKGWLAGWVRTCFKGKKNEDLWRAYLAAASEHEVRFIWVKGHADNPYNNRCDQLAVAAANGADLSIDAGYERIMNYEL
jgi:ribonuclease HI